VPFLGVLGGRLTESGDHSSGNGNGGKRWKTVKGRDQANGVGCSCAYVKCSEGTKSSTLWTFWGGKKAGW